ncbi:efflux RND transporter periplasmic adaptor subunit [Kordiimonas sp. SCSIO 12603]|uniref:efflux RND transporter periplasmic adaptor subunit n=1 Tax=Kordiimonas sp. SCSIO 12603 TaxID=2829596 RepID=UPI002106E734|nr:efflux RND transporter periplasmic adaptor subunit [Kordiimonas sp. SCSIO 12603]UTW59678.1 efflux RND transporter periplasmic adaptor subunit [Kordiimonas sp. SCSIO 12603]
MTILNRLQNRMKTRVAILCGIGLMAMNPAIAQNGPPPAVVEIAEASTEVMAPQVFMPGTVVSRNDSRIAAEIAGRVMSVVPEGTAVQKGDVIAEIDNRNLKLQLERNKSQIKRLEARIRFLEADLKRVKELAETNHTPASRVDEAQSQLDMTQEELAQAKLNLDQTRVDLDRTKVRAPFPGRVVERLAQAGEYSAPGREIVRLVDTGHLEVSAQAPVNLASVLSDNQRVALRQGGSFSDATIRALIPVGDAVSRTMEIRVEVPEGAAFVVGAAVQIGLPSSAPEQVVAVPRDALVLRREGTYVFRVKEDNTAERLTVRTGAANGALVAVVGNISNGDRVVIRGGERLRSGQQVKLRDEVTTSR